MPALTIKNIPDALYDRLKTSAAGHRRSLNSELIACLEQQLMPSKVTARERISRARALRLDIPADRVGPGDIEQAIAEGRP